MADPKKNDGAPIDVECHVLPLLRLCQWAVEAGETLRDIQFLREKVPAFEAACTKYMGNVCNPDPFMPSDLIAETLGAAIDLLMRHEAEDE